MAADVGTLQRLPKVIGSDSLARELCYTARKFSADEALTHGLVSKIYSDKERYVEPLCFIRNFVNLNFNFQHDEGSATAS